MIRRLQVHTANNAALDDFVHGMQRAGWRYVKDEAQGPITAVVMDSPSSSLSPRLKVDEKQHFEDKGRK